MAKLRGIHSALYIQTTDASTPVTGAALSRVGQTLWYMVTSPTNYYWDKEKTIKVYDGGVQVTPLEYDYASGAVRLLNPPSGAVTADFYKFGCSQFGGFRSFSLDENMELIECGCFEDEGEIYEPGMYSASGSGDGFWSSVDSFRDLNGLTLLSKLIGELGDEISVQCVVAGNNTPLTVSVAGKEITINSATDSAGAAISKNWQIMNAIMADPEASALVRCRYTTNYATDSQTIMGAMPNANLGGGVTPAMLARFGEDILAVFYWDTGASLTRTVGLITFEKQSVKAGVKGLVGKTLSWKSQGMLYERAG